MAPRKMKPGSVYDGPKAIFDVDGVVAHYAIDEDGNPGARLVQIDLAPEDPDDGSEEYRIAADEDPPQITSLVELEVDAQGQASTEV